MYKLKAGIEELYRVSPRQGRGGYLRLDMNENPEGLPKDFFNKVISTLTPELLAMYPEAGTLINKIADYLDIVPEMITLSNGSDEAIKCIFEVFGNSGNLVSVYPTFEMYVVYANLYGLEHRVINYRSDLTINIDDVIDAIDLETCIVSLLNPNNPIGNVYTMKETERVIKRAAECGAIVVIDEAYHYFYPITFIELAKKYDNVLLTRTFSKLCSIAGCRIGYAVGNARLISLLNKVRGTYCCNIVALIFAEAILDDKELIPAFIKNEKMGREFVISSLAENGYEHYAKNGNYIFIKPHRPAREVSAELEAEKILVKTYSHQLLKDYIRITTGGIEPMRRFCEMFYKIDKER